MSQYGDKRDMKSIIFIFLMLSSYLFSSSSLDKNGSIKYATKVIVDKSDRRLYLFYHNQLLKSYHISLGKKPKGPKRVEGDKKTPEGSYILDFKKKNSSYYRAIHISYPNKSDIEYAKKLGKSPGGAIMIHGQPNGWGWLSPIMQRFDWTSGCIALSNKDMDEIWKLVKTGTPIIIRE